MESATSGYVVIDHKEAYQRNALEAKQVSLRIGAGLAHQNPVSIEWDLLDEQNARLDKATGLVFGQVCYRLVRDDAGYWSLFVNRDGSEYRVIDAMIRKAIKYGEVVDGMMDTEKLGRGQRKAVERIRRLVEWMIQDAWDLRQVASAHTFRGLLALNGLVQKKRAIHEHLKAIGCLALKHRRMKVWLEAPVWPVPNGMQTVPTPPEQDWKALVESWHGTADAWAGRAFCPKCHTVNATRPFCIECGTLVKLAHTPIQQSDLSYLD